MIGYGITEYRLTLAASFQLFGALAIVAYLTGADVSRGYFLLSLPLGTTALLTGRALCRLWLRHRRRHGLMNARVILVGGADENARVAAELAAQPLRDCRSSASTSFPAKPPRGTRCRPRPFAGF